MGLKYTSILCALVCTSSAALAEPVLVGQNMNFATNQPTTAYFVDFSTIKQDKDPAYVLMAVTVKYVQPQAYSNGKSYVASVNLSRYDCKYGQGFQDLTEALYSSYEMDSKSLVYSTPKPTKNLSVMPSQWRHVEPNYPVIVGHPNNSLQDVACGKLTRADFR